MFIPDRESRGNSLQMGQWQHSCSLFRRKQQVESIHGFTHRIIFDVLSLYIHMAIRKACYETALNSSLLLFSFFPQGDPTGQLLLIPYLALTTQHYALIERMMESGFAIGTLLLGMLPNWSFDYGLALYRENKECAREQIKPSLRRWPQVIRMFVETAV